MFRSFYLAGFECATGWNMHREWIDQIAATGHDLHLDADYERLAHVGIHAVREAIRWPLVDRLGRYDFSCVRPFAEAAVRHGVDVIWDLFHYGYPEDLDPFDERFVQRFVDYCRAAARYVARYSEGPHYFTPVNEPSYFAWAAAEVGHFAPHARGRGFELKVILARAAIRAIEAIRDEVPSARIVNVDPICRVVPCSGDPGAIEHARLFNEEWVFEFWDIVAGRKMPELGGSRQHLDIVGINYYWTNQWELGADGVPLAENDPRRLPLADLVRNTWRRYGTEVVITETSALGDERGPWIHHLSGMTEQLIADGVPLRGICLYPILGMPEWHAREQWTHMGLWDIRSENGMQREPCSPGLEALQTAQQKTRLGGLVREQMHRVARTGNSEFRFLGQLVWQHAHSSGQSLRLFRSNRPYRLWIAAMAFPTAAANLEHVRTAAKLSMLLGDLTWLSPAEVARMHGISGVENEVAQRWWRSAVEELVRRATELEGTPNPSHSIDESWRYPVVGGGRH